MSSESTLKENQASAWSEPVGIAEFSHIMDAFGVFESGPVIAVGVSGGADSLALSLLMHQWACLRGGHVVGLIVDHGLRPNSDSEASWVADQLGRFGINHHVLSWHGDKPVAAVQEKARMARQRLMLDWCRKRGVLHLALGHHANDQVETHLMRLARGGNATGLAAMSLVREHSAARIIRPLLMVGKSRLEATLAEMGEEWVCDPSNENEQFERTRVRNAVRELCAEGGDVSHLADSIREYGNLRRDLEQQGALALASCAALYPAGYARLNARTLQDQGSATGQYALSRLIMAVGGRRYPVNREKLLRAYNELTQQNPARRLTLGGCVLEATDNGYLISREVRNLPVPLCPDTQGSVYWDNRFLLVPGGRTKSGARSHIRALGRRGWDRLVQKLPELRGHSVPLSARYALPALTHNDEIIAVSHLTGHYPTDHPWRAGFEKAMFLPCEPVLGGTFSVALTDFCTISEGHITVPATDERIDA